MTKTFDIGLYHYVMSLPEGLPHKEYRKELARHVTTLSEGVREDLRGRRYEILEAWADWVDDNYEVLLRLGFPPREAEMLKDKRLNSPGMRNVLRIRMLEFAR